MFFTPIRSCLLLIHSNSHSFPLSLVLSSCPIHFLFSSPFWPFSHCQSTSSLIFVPLLFWLHLLTNNIASYCHSLFVFTLKGIFHTIFPFVCSISTSLYFRLCAVCYGKEQHALCTWQSKCHLLSPIPCTGSYADSWIRPRFLKTY